MTRSKPMRWMLPAALLLTASGAVAQPAPQPRQPAPSEPAPPPAIEPRGRVVRPPAPVDPGIQAPLPPAEAPMPVIPPPGTPRGDRRIEPR